MYELPKHLVYFARLSPIINAKSITFLKKLAGESPVPDEFIFAARQHGVGYIVLRNVLELAESNGFVLPNKIKKAFSEDQANGVARLASLRRADELDAYLRSNGLKSVRLKGRSYVTWMYGNAVSRSSTDSDMLMLGKDLERAERLLFRFAEENGYEVESNRICSKSNLSPVLRIVFGSATSPT